MHSFYSSLIQEQYLLPLHCEHACIFSSQEQISKEGLFLKAFPKYGQICSKTHWGCGCRGDIFSSATTRQVSKAPEATCHHPAMGVKTPVPPPTKTLEYGFPTPPAPSSRYSPFICTPSKASGALPSTTDSISLISMPAESKAALLASNAISLPVSSILLLNRVIPAPIIATLLFPTTHCHIARIIAPPVGDDKPLHDATRALVTLFNCIAPASPLS